MDEAANACVGEPGCGSDLGGPACQHCLGAPQGGVPLPVQESTAHGPRGWGPDSPPTPGGSLLSLPLPAGRKLGTLQRPSAPLSPQLGCAAPGVSRAPGGALSCPQGDAGVSVLRRHGTTSLRACGAVRAWVPGLWGRNDQLTWGSLSPLPSGPKDRPAALGKTKAFSHFPEGSHPAAPA